MDPVLGIIWAVVFVAVVVTVTGLTGKAGWSAPVALVVVGAIASFVPGVPQVELQPELVLYGILPPLLFATAVRTSIIDVRARGDGILLLSVGLVVFTAAFVGATLWLLVPAIGLAAAFAFGAVVAPTDAVAVNAVMGGAGLPRRLRTVIEGESLLNDATALVLLGATSAAIVGVVDPVQVGVDFVLAVVVGAVFGFAVGGIMSLIHGRLRSPVLDASLTLVTPYLAFIPAQLLHGSGVLAVVITGFIIGWRGPVVQSAEARIADSVLWRTLAFLLENAVFLFMGLSLAGIASSVRTGPGVGWTIVICVVVLASLIASRMAWMFLIGPLYRLGPQWLRDRSGWSSRVALALSFTGVRGVVTLAAAFLLPEGTKYREFLQFLAFVVVAGTLLEGLLIPRIIRALKLPAPDLAQEDTELQLLLAEAQEAGAQELEGEAAEGVEDRVVDRLRSDASFLSDALQNPAPDGAEPTAVAFTRLRLLMLSAERSAILLARTERRYQETAIQGALAYVDAEETALRRGSPFVPELDDDAGDDDDDFDVDTDADAADAASSASDAADDTDAADAAPVPAPGRASDAVVGGTSARASDPR